MVNTLDNSVDHQHLKKRFKDSNSKASRIKDSDDNFYDLQFLKNCLTKIETLQKEIQRLKSENKQVRKELVETYTKNNRKYSKTILDCHQEISKLKLQNQLIEAKSQTKNLKETQNNLVLNTPKKNKTINKSRRYGDDRTINLSLSAPKKSLRQNNTNTEYENYKRPQFDNSTKITKGTGFPTKTKPNNIRRRVYPHSEMKKHPKLNSLSQAPPVKVTPSMYTLKVGGFNINIRPEDNPDYSIHQHRQQQSQPLNLAENNSKRKLDFEKCGQEKPSFEDSLPSKKEYLLKGIDKVERRLYKYIDQISPQKGIIQLKNICIENMREKESLLKDFQHCQTLNRHIFNIVVWISKQKKMTSNDIQSVDLMTVDEGYKIIMQESELAYLQKNLKNLVKLKIKYQDSKLLIQEYDKNFGQRIHQIQRDISLKQEYGQHYFNLQNQKIEKMQNDKTDDKRKLDQIDRGIQVDEGVQYSINGRDSFLKNEDVFKYKLDEERMSVSRRGSAISEGDIQDIESYSQGMRTGKKRRGSRRASRKSIKTKSRIGDFESDDVVTFIYMQSKAIERILNIENFDTEKSEAETIVETFQNDKEEGRDNSFQVEKFEDTKDGSIVGAVEGESDQKKVNQAMTTIDYIGIEQVTQESEPLTFDDSTSNPVQILEIEDQKKIQKQNLMVENIPLQLDYEDSKYMSPKFGG